MGLADSDERLLASILPELIVPGTTAIAVVGSFGRGNPGPESDVNITRFRDTVPEAGVERYRVTYRSARLVAVLDTTLGDVRSGLDTPERAIWTVPYLRSVRPLYDPTEQLAQLQAEAWSFAWERLQPRANDYASHRLMKFSEEALKLGLGLRSHDEQRIMTETVWLILGLPLVIAVQRGIFLENEMRAPMQVQEVVGRESEWSLPAFSTAIHKPQMSWWSLVHCRTSRSSTGGVPAGPTRHGTLPESHFGPCPISSRGTGLFRRSKLMKRERLASSDGTFSSRCSRLGGARSLHTPGRSAR